MVDTLELPALTAIVAHLNPRGKRQVPAFHSWQTKTIDSLSTLEDFLDQLEARGYDERKFVVRGDTAFDVSWR